MKTDLSRFAPPGYNIQREFRFFIVGNLLSFGISLFYLIRLSGSINNLYEYNGTEKVLIASMAMPDFMEILGSTLIGFLLVSLCMLTMIFFRYGYHYQHSKSIYLMKRLPNRMELHKRCLCLPILGALLCILLLIILFFIYFGIYLIATPKQCLTPNQWQKIWEVLLCLK